MDERGLRAFAAVAECGSLLAAAEELHLTPSAISKQISRLERDAGLCLLRRSKHRTSLTDDGQLFLPVARDLLRALGRARAAASHIAARDRLQETSLADGRRAGRPRGSQGRPGNTSP